VYNASKAYLLNLSRSLWYEMMPHGVHVLAVAPGSTDTSLLPFPEPLARWFRRLGITMSPDRLVRRALRLLFRSRRKVCMPGIWNCLTVPFLRLLPDRLVLSLFRRFESSQ